MESRETVSQNAFSKASFSRLVPQDVFTIFPLWPLLSSYQHSIHVLQEVRSMQMKIKTGSAIRRILIFYTLKDKVIDWWELRFTFY